jgi:hypothetical protein
VELLSPKASEAKTQQSCGTVEAQAEKSGSIGMWAGTTRTEWRIAVASGPNEGRHGCATQVHGPKQAAKW